MSASRHHDLTSFYDLLHGLESDTAARLLKDSDGRLQWPNRGIYFFFDASESRTDTGSGKRLVRVGTHALKTGSRTSLWNRLSQHRGTAKSGGGNHRGSIFRLLVGEALISEQGLDCETWGKGNSAPREIRDAELELEQFVSKYIGHMPFLWLGIEDEANPESLRGYIERNSIALASNANKPPLDRLSDNWLGHRSSRERVNNSELWNQNHVDEAYDPAFLQILEKQIRYNRE